jgi:hypothetical protein
MISGIDIEDMKPDIQKRNATNHKGWVVEWYDVISGWTICHRCASKEHAIKSCLSWEAFWPNIEFRVYEEVT